MAVLRPAGEALPCRRGQLECRKCWMFHALMALVRLAAHVGSSECPYDRSRATRRHSAPGVFALTQACRIPGLYVINLPRGRRGCKARPQQRKTAAKRIARLPTDGSDDEEPPRNRLDTAQDGTESRGPRRIPRPVGGATMRPEKERRTFPFRQEGAGGRDASVGCGRARDVRRHPDRVAATEGNRAAGASPQPALAALPASPPSRLGQGEGDRIKGVARPAALSLRSAWPPASVKAASPP